MKKWSEFLEGRCWPGYKPKPGKKAYSPGSCVKEDLRQWFDPDHPKGGWKRINSKGEAIGPCAREPGEAKPKCMSNEKRAKLDKKERASAVASKRKHDPNPERKGEPINVSNFGKGKISENMENLEEKNVPTSPEKWAQAKSQAKAKFDVYPSAYANGWAAKKYKEMGGGWKSVSEAVKDKFDIGEYDQEGDMAKSDLRSIIANAQTLHDMLDDADNLPEWVQSKITLAQDYMSTVANYMASEMKEEVEQVQEIDLEEGAFSSGQLVASKKFKKEVEKIPSKGTVRNKDEKGVYTAKTVNGKEVSRVYEDAEQIDELSKDTLKSYMDKSSKDNLTSLMKPGMIAKKHAAKRFIGMMKAGEKLTKEANSVNMPADIGTPAQLSLKPNPKKLETPVYEAKSDIPFEGPYSKAKDTITDKSGAKHGPMSRVRSLARQAIQKQKVTQKKTVNESRRMEIVREAMVDAKKKDAVKKVEKKVTTGGNDKFQADPELSSSITKSA
jgi:hypothetical protein